MQNTFFGKLGGWQLTAMLSTALLAPTAIYAAANYQAVAVTDPGTGTVATVDTLAKLHSVDFYAQFANNPSLKVSIGFPMYTADGCDTISYTIPAGKGLLIT
jgi:hypothetical protein